MAKLISKTYGDALFSVATESGKMDSFLESAKGVREAFSENEDLVKLMNHPKVTKEEKAGILENCFKGRIEDELLGTMLLMVTKDRFFEIDEVLSYFITRVKEYNNIGLATVTSAKALSDSQKEKIKKRLLETTDYKEFEIVYKEDPSLIGGLVIRIKDRVVDSSIKTKIEKLSRNLSETKLKAGESAQ